MKVLLINSVCGSGSTGRIVSEIWKLLKAQGHEVKVAYGIGQASLVSNEDTYRINNKMGYYLHNALARITDRAGFYSIYHTIKLVRYIKAYKPDVVHLHNLHGFYINISILFRFLASINVKVIWTLHDCWGITGHCAHYSYEGCYKWQNECHDCSLKKSYPQSLLLDQSRRNFNDKLDLYSKIKDLTITTPSEWLANVVRSSVLLRGRNVYAIPNGIDLDVFKPTPSNLRKKYGVNESDTLLLGVSSVWYFKKGYEDFKKLASKLPSNYKLMMVGLNKDQIQEMPNNVIGVERTHDAIELAAIYTMADVFLNLSYEETMGLVTAEALACGTPAIVYDKTAVPEVVDEDSGVVVEAGMINEILSNIERVKLMACEDCVNRARAYEKQNQYSKVLDLYK